MLRVLARRGTRLAKGGLLVLPIGYLLVLGWHELRFREGVVAVLPSVGSASAPPAALPLNATAIATVLGLTTEAPPLASAEPLTLHASFVQSDGLSKALLAGPLGPRMYQVGERLPGGSVLRRVEATQVVLWNKGREELLALQPSTTRFLRPFEALTQPAASAVSTRFLRPHSGQSE